MLNRDSTDHRQTLLRLSRGAISLTRDMTYKRAAMIELVRDRPEVFPRDEFQRFRRQIHRYGALVEDAHDFAEHCRFLLEEPRAQVVESTNKNLYVLTIFSAVFLPATLLSGLWGMNVGSLPFGASTDGFWEVTGLIGGNPGGHSHRPAAVAFLLTATLSRRPRRPGRWLSARALMASVVADLADHRMFAAPLVTESSPIPDFCASPMPTELER